MSTIVGEYLVQCPHCNSETKLVAEMRSPIVISCPGCDRSIVITGAIIFTVPSEFVYGLHKKYNTKIIGRVLASEVSQKAKELMSLDTINHLHDLLEQPLDVNDFLKKL